MATPDRVRRYRQRLKAGHMIAHVRINLSLGEEMTRLDLIQDPDLQGRVNGQVEALKRGEAVLAYIDYLRARLVTAP